MALSKQKREQRRTDHPGWWVWRSRRAGGHVWQECECAEQAEAIAQWWRDEKFYQTRVYFNGLVWMDGGHTSKVRIINPNNNLTNLMSRAATSGV